VGRIRRARNRERIVASGLSASVGAVTPLLAVTSKGGLEIDRWIDLPDEARRELWSAAAASRAIQAAVQPGGVAAITAGLEVPRTRTRT